MTVYVKQITCAPVHIGTIHYAFYVCDFSKLMMWWLHGYRHYIQMASLQCVSFCAPLKCSHPCIHNHKIHIHKASPLYAVVHELSKLSLWWLHSHKIYICMVSPQYVSEGVLLNRLQRDMHRTRCQL